MAVELIGFDELRNDLVQMAQRLDNGPGVGRALKAGAEPIEQQMKANASSDPAIITGALYGSIHTSNVKGGANGKRVTIGVHVKEKSAYYSSPVEYGHGGPAPAPPHPFVRPAFDAKANEAYAEMKRVLNEELIN